MRKRGGWRIPLLLLVAAVALGTLLAVELHDRAATKKQEELMEQAAPLEKERDALVTQRDLLEREFRESTAVPATEQLIFLEMDPLIYTEVFPLMRERDIPGVLALYPGNMPGDPGCLSRDAFNELTAAGWELCLYCDGTESFLQWDREMTELLAQAGIAKPKAVYFPEDAFRIALQEDLIACGYTVAIHHGEDRQELIAGDADEELWLTGAHPWNYVGVRDEIKEVVRLGGQHCFTVRFTEGREEYSSNGFVTMLEFIDPFQQEGKLQVTGLMTARDRHDPSKNGYRAVWEEWQRQDAALKEEIRRLNEEIQRIYSQWDGE